MYFMTITKTLPTRGSRISQIRSWSSVLIARNNLKIISSRRRRVIHAALDTCSEKQFFFQRSPMKVFAHIYVYTYIYLYTYYTLTRSVASAMPTRWCKKRSKNEDSTTIKTDWIDRHLASRLVVAPDTYPENRPGFQETVLDGSYASHTPRPGWLPFTCYHCHTLFTPRTAPPPHARSLARSCRLQRRIIALPPIELDGSSGEDEDQTRDEETERLTRRDQDEAPRHHATASTTRYHDSVIIVQVSSDDSDVKCTWISISYLDIRPQMPAIQSFPATSASIYT